MKALLFLCLLTFHAAVLTAAAQEDTARHRAAYGRINNAQNALQKRSATYNDEPTLFALTGWMKDGKVEKIVAKNGDDGEGVEEFYLEDERPLFVYSTYYQTAEEGKRGPRVEERIYFREGAVFKWLTTQKPTPIFHGEDYQAATQRLTENCKGFVAALKKASIAPGAKLEKKMKEGIFTGIEEGDYAHWNMRSNSGEELSFFILKTDATLEKVLAKPADYVGKSCRVTWAAGYENIPEAGGSTEIQQVLAVEWLGK